MKALVLSNNLLITEETIVTPGNYCLVIGKRQLVYTLPGISQNLRFAYSLDEIQLNDNDNHNDTDSDYNDYHDYRVRKINIHRWGDYPYHHFNISSRVIHKLTILAKDTPNLTECLSMRSCFRGPLQIIGDLSQWDTSNVTNMSGMFQENNFFNLDISNFNTSNVTVRYQI